MSQGQKVPAGLPKWAVLISDYARAAADDDVKKAHSIWFEIMDFMAERENESTASALRERRMREALQHEVDNCPNCLGKGKYGRGYIEAPRGYREIVPCERCAASRAALAQETHHE